MGCATSKLHNLPAVALCRDRCKFLDQALIFSHALVDSHSNYAESLTIVASALHRLFDQDGGDSKDWPPAAAPSFDSSPSDSDSDEEDGSFTPEKTLSSPTGNFMFSNYDSARGQPPPPPPTGSSWDFLNFFETYEQPVFNWDREGGADQKSRTTRDRVVAKKKKKKGAAVVDSKNTEEAKELNQPEKKSDSKMGVSDLMREIKGSFQKASESGNSISKLIYYGQRTDFSKGSRGLSSTLKKLCVWEQKLYLEVKAEERLRMILEKKWRQMKHLVEKKADDRKVESVKTVIRNLSIKLKVSIQVVDRISITISKLRDEEFLGEITQLIHGLLSMWKAMLDSHKHQTQVLTQSKPWESALHNGKLDDIHLEAAMDLKLELENWRAAFSTLITTQKDCIKSLNGWLLRCLLYEPEPEETPNDARPLPFSPARIGAPPAFVFCHLWSETVDKFSDEEVSEAIFGVVSVLDEALEEQSEDLQRMGLASKMKMKMKKTNQEKTAAVTAETLHKTGKFSGCDVQLGMKRIFAALVRFCEDSIKAHEELCSAMEKQEQNQVHS